MNVLHPASLLRAGERLTAMRTVVARIQRVKPGMSGTGLHGVLAHCPVPHHGRGRGDQSRSLSVTEGDRGQVLLHCFAGCHLDDILKALDLTVSDLYPESDRLNGGPGGTSLGVHSAAEDACQVLRDRQSSATFCIAHYVYRDDEGSPIAEVHRWEPRTFRPFTLDPSTGAWKSGGGVPKVLYGRESATRVAGDPEAVLLVAEGEKDADLVNHFADPSWAAVTNAHGAEAWHPEHTEAIASWAPAARIVVCSDNDEAGRKRTSRVTDALSHAGLRVEVAWPRHGADISEHVEAGGTLDFNPDSGLILEVPALEASPTSDIGKADELHLPLLGRTFARSDLLSLPVIEPLIEGYLSIPATAMLVGAYGTGKTALALAWACCIATGTPFLGKAVRQEKVLYIVGEGAYGMHRRIAAWETTWKLQISDEAFTIMGKPVASLKDEATWRELAAYCRDHGIKVIICDTVSALAPDMDEVRNSASLVSGANSLARAISGTVLLLHHPGWSDAAQGRARGGYQFEGNIDEVLVLEAMPKGSDQLVVTVKKEKDGPSGAKHYLRRLIVDLPATNGEPASTSITVEGARLTDNTAPIKMRILTYLEECGDIGASPKEIAINTGADSSAGNFKTALRHLAADESIIKTGNTSRTRYFIAGQEPQQ